MPPVLPLCVQMVRVICLLETELQPNTFLVELKLRRKIVIQVFPGLTAGPAYVKGWVHRRLPDRKSMTCPSVLRRREILKLM